MKIVLALGGNAISRRDEKGDIPDQTRNSRISAEHIVDLVEAGHQVVATHGNGPQVGNVLRRVEAGRKFLYTLPLDICGAHTQGGMGYMFQREISNVFHARGMDKIAFTIVTQCLVSEDDPAFTNPTKPIGPFFTREQIQPMIDSDGWKVVEIANQGWRRVVPSPKPLRIIEERAIRKALETGDVLVCCGGGGIPVVSREGMLHGVEGVIDKDFGTGLLARTIDADLLVITTDVEKVALHFREANPLWLDRLSVSEARAYFSAGEFPAGSMGPKIQAAIEFTELTGKETIITSPEKTIDAIAGRTGTWIFRG